MLTALVLALAASGASAARIKWAGSQGPSAGFLACGADSSSTNNRRLVHTNWDFRVGEETKFKISEEGANLCLDAGLQQYNGSPVKVWECLDGVPQQQWFVSNEGQFKLANTIIEVHKASSATDLVPRPPRPPRPCPVHSYLCLGSQRSSTIDLQSVPVVLANSHPPAAGYRGRVISGSNLDMCPFHFGADVIKLRFSGGLLERLIGPAAPPSVLAFGPAYLSAPLLLQEENARRRCPDKEIRNAAATGRLVASCSGVPAGSAMQT
ncbi:hypothetical protein A1Q1_01812 [Trichosporon asahii var. asahii CBS 2479]|uniref:Uncharacterized protein n=1 Tax=Trichosporon asahii var. asahii (strain ATCC 90039 / CBS 2479 / JCM 2466 / KCTC 7840 / NBRC 103889/ NCYC 2677 / UAMH 7654) TaxID=1186058 RepID=J5QUG7_TRIAS|nr:hypothetical protein A1Q1_01812 [Trichosporon asahii var. asahii CBS 2479]EJT49163.1 hypothetical protein A1Q1_01812 [Trichosporon asahii var. asahii CBS 2479]